MASIVIDLDEDFVRRLAEEIAHARAEQTLADAGMTTSRAGAPRSAQADPWADDVSSDADFTDDPPATVSATQRRQSAPARPAPAQTRSGTVVVNTPKGAQRWTLGAANAPACLCGDPAAYVEGKTNGRGWKRWACALGASDTSWQNKCDFSQWA